MPCPAVPCRAVRYCATVRCCAVLCRGECLTVLTLILLNHNKDAPPAQLSPQLYIVHSSAATCGAVRCRALPCVRCCFMLRCAFFPTYSSARCTTRSTRYQVGTGMYVILYSFFAFFKVDSLLSVFMFLSPRKLHPHCRSEFDIANKHTAKCKHRATINSSAQAALGIIHSLVAPNHGPLLTAPFTYMF